MDVIQADYNNYSNLQCMRAQEIILENVRQMRDKSTDLVVLSENE